MKITLTERGRTVSRNLTETPFRPSGYVASMYKAEFPSAGRAVLADVIPDDNRGEGDVYRLVFSDQVKRPGYTHKYDWKPRPSNVLLRVQGSQQIRDQFRERLMREVRAL